MKHIMVVSGSRADWGLLEWPIVALQREFTVSLQKLWGRTFDSAFSMVESWLQVQRPDCMLVLGDRFEILAAATAAHLQRVPIAHIAGGDVTEGSYDDAMRDCISRMASIHFVTSSSAQARLCQMGFKNVHLVGNPAVDYIKHGDWKRERPIDEPYVVVSYQPETIDGTNEIGKLLVELPERMHQCFIMPNKDRGSDEIRKAIIDAQLGIETSYHEFLPHDEFLNLIFHCEEFIGNSSAMLYEAPELGIKTRMIGKRQRGRVLPWGDGQASERMVKILKYTNV